MTKDLIFLISQPRSGSTMLQAILGSHPEIHTCSEPWIALPFIYALKRDGSEFEFDGQLSKKAINAFFKANGISDELYKSALNSFLTTFYNEALNKSGKRFFLDKTPRYYEIASDLINIFPTARFIVLYRHPLSVLNSILKTWVKGDIDKLFYFSRDLLVAPKKLTEFVAEYHQNICLVRYEDLVSSPETEIEKICKYIGVEFLEEIINYKAESDWVYGDKNFLEKKAPDLKSIDSWQKQLADEHATNFSFYYLRELGEEIYNALGYNYSFALDHIKKQHPNEKDFKAWKTLLHGQHIVTVEGQRLQAWNKIRWNYLKILFKKLMT